MKKQATIVALLLALSGCERADDAPATKPEARAEPVVVYASYTDENYLPSLFAGFTEATGIRVTVKHGDERRIVGDVIEKRGSPPADLLLTRSAYGVWKAAEEGALRPLQSASIAELVPPRLRDPDGYWVATGFTIGLIAFNDEEIEASSLLSFPDLGKADFAGRVCLSSSELAVNRMIIANLIAELGVRPAEIQVRGWVRNLARAPFDSEAELLEAIDAGRCALGIVSSRAFTRTTTSSTSAVGPEPGYIDVEAIGIGRHARSAESSRRLVEWLLAANVQGAHATAVGLLPANARALTDRSPHVSVADARNAGIAGAYHDDAVKLAERASYR